MPPQYKSFTSDCRLARVEGRLAARAAFTRGLIDAYDKIRGRRPDDAYWDLVVITAGAAEQRDWYEQQVEEKRRRGELPDGLQFRVIADPGGVRTGDGGATLHVISELHRDLGDALFETRVLLIHSGGYSKRMPSHSCGSKIFSALPVARNNTEERLYQVDLSIRFSYLVVFDCVFLPFPDAGPQAGQLLAFRGAS